MPSILLIEGKYYDKLIQNICQRAQLGIPMLFKMAGQGGIGHLLGSLELAVKSEAEVVAVICDADEDCAKRWKEIKAACRRGGLELGDEAISTEGFIWIRPGQRKFGCWIMPDNRQSGALEGRLLDGIALAEQQLLREQARAFIERVEPRLFPDTEAALQKATLRAWFAVQEEPIWLPSFAVEHLLLLPKLEENDAFVAWLRELDAVAGLTAV